MYSIASSWVKVFETKSGYQKNVIDSRNFVQSFGEVDRNTDTFLSFLKTIKGKCVIYSSNTRAKLVK